MIKSINSKKKVKRLEVGSWLLKLLSRDIKTRSKSQPTNKHNIQQNTKNNGKYNTYHGLLSLEWIDGRY